MRTDQINMSCLSPFDLRIKLVLNRVVGAEVEIETNAQT
jgi:hypothetical protein